MITILVTSVGSLVSQNLLDSLEGRRHGFRVVATTSRASVPLGRCDKVYLVPETGQQGAGFRNRFLQILQTENPDLVIPGRDADVTTLARLAVEFPALAPRLPCGNPACADTFGDKWLSWQFADAHGLPFAASAMASAEETESLRAFAREVGWPVIAKPRLGFASRGVKLLFTESQLKATGALPEIVFQEYLGDPQAAVSFLAAVDREGLPLFYTLEREKYSVQLYLRGDGSVAGPFCTRNLMREGQSVDVEPVDDAELTTLGTRYASTFREAGWRGPLNIQCQRRPGGPLKAYELNGRMTGATAARYFLGFDELGLALQDLLDMQPPQSPARSSTVPLKFRHTTAVARADVERLEATGVWER